MMKRIERRADAVPDRRRARGGELLAADDRGKTGKAGLALPQRRHAREFEYRSKPRVLLDQRVDGIFEIGLGVEVNGHWINSVVMAGLVPPIHVFYLSPAYLTRASPLVSRDRNLTCFWCGIEDVDGRDKPGNDEIHGMPPPVFRFAPSPNGYLHLGHAYSALLNFDLARRGGGRFLLRIEDIDATRCRPEFEAAIYEDLAWLGIAWETPVRRQSGHFADYRAAVEKLSAQGLIYPSFESRAEIARLVAQREAAGDMAARPRRRAALSGRREIAVAG